MHGQDRGIKDIDLVNLCRTGNAYSPCNGLPLDDFTQLSTLMVGELLRVVEQRMLKVIRQDDGSSIDSTSQSSSPSLVRASLHKARIEVFLEHRLL